jgi:RNA binding exosome subunit
MNNLIRQILCELFIKDHSLLNDLPRCKNNLKEQCIKQDSPLEVNILVTALEAKVPNDLLLEKKKGTPSTILLSNLTKKLVVVEGMSEENAKWAVESWALALKVISSAEGKTTSLLTNVKTGNNKAKGVGEPEENGASTASLPPTSTTSIGASSPLFSGSPVSSVSPNPSSSITRKKTSLALLIFLFILVFASAIGGLLYFSPHISVLCQGLNNCVKDGEYKELYEQAVKNAEFSLAINAKNLEDLDKIHNLLNNAIRDLNTIPSEAKVYLDAQKALGKYSTKLEVIDNQLTKETKAKKMLDDAKSVAINAEKQANVAETISQFEDAKSEWQNSLDKLKEIPLDSLIVDQAKALIQEYNDKVISIDNKISALNAEKISTPPSVLRPEPTPPPSSPVSGSTPPLPKPTPTPSLLPCDTALYGDCQ